jgi:hypothetical protein
MLGCIQFHPFSVSLKRMIFLKIFGLLRDALHCRKKGVQDDQKHRLRDKYCKKYIFLNNARKNLFVCIVLQMYKSRMK